MEWPEIFEETFSSVKPYQLSSSILIGIVSFTVAMLYFITKNASEGVYEEE